MAYETRATLLLLAPSNQYRGEPPNTPTRRARDVIRGELRFPAVFTGLRTIISQTRVAEVCRRLFPPRPPKNPEKFVEEEVYKRRTRRGSVW